MGRDQTEMNVGQMLFFSGLASRCPFVSFRSNWNFFVASAFSCKRNSYFMASQVLKKKTLEIHNKCILVRQKIGKWPPASSHINFGGNAFFCHYVLSQELQIFIKSIKMVRMLNVSFSSGNSHCHTEDRIF